MKMKKYRVHIVWAIVVVLALVGGYYYGKSAGRPSFAGFGGTGSSTRGGFAGRGAGGAGGGFAAGQVTAKDSTSLTLQLANGNSEVVFYSSSTSVIEPQPASINDVTPGTNVMVGGTTNSDGSVTAQSIQVRTASSTGGFGGGAGRPSGGTAPTSQY